MPPFQFVALFFHVHNKTVHFLNIKKAPIAATTFLKNGTVSGWGHPKKKAKPAHSLIGGLGGVGVGLTWCHHSSSWGVFVSCAQQDCALSEYPKTTHCFNDIFEKRDRFWPGSPRKMTKKMYNKLRLPPPIPANSSTASPDGIRGWILSGARTPRTPCAAVRQGYRKQSRMQNVAQPQLFTHTHIHTHTHTHTHTLCNGSNTTTVEARRALHWTASARQASKNNESDVVMWLGAFLQCTHTHTHTHTHIIFRMPTCHTPVHVTPSPEYPALQVQVKDPAVLVHAALASQL